MSKKKLPFYKNNGRSRSLNFGLGSCLNSCHVLAESKRNRSATASLKLKTGEVKLCRFPTWKDVKGRHGDPAHTSNNQIYTILSSYRNKIRYNIYLTKIKKNTTKHVGKVPSQPSCPFGSTHLDKGTKPKFCCRSLMRREDFIEDVTHLAMRCNQLAPINYIVFDQSSRIQ